jgi:hypothetical protein
MTDWHDDGQAAEQRRQEELRRDIEDALTKAAPHLTKDELSLLAWATGANIKDRNDGQTRD